MDDPKDGRIFRDMNSYILDWLSAEPAPEPPAPEEEGKRVSTLMGILSKESAKSNVVPFKPRKK